MGVNDFLCLKVYFARVFKDEHDMKIFDLLIELISRYLFHEYIDEVFTMDNNVQSTCKIKETNHMHKSMSIYTFQVNNI